MAQRRSIITIAALCFCGGAFLGVMAPWSSSDLSALTQRVEKAAPEGKRPGRPAMSRVAGVGVDTVGTASFADMIEAVGSIRANQSVAIVAEDSGRVAEINFRAGQAVKKGDLLIQLDDRDEKIALDEANAAFTEAQAAYERQKTLASSKVATQATLEAAQALYLKTKAAVEKAKRNLDRQQIRAPFDGIVGLSRTDIGAWVTPSEVLTTLDDLETVEVEFQVPERMLTEVRDGQTIHITTPSYAGRSFAGVISDIDSRVDPASRAFTVRAKIDNADLALKPGMFVNVNITLRERTVVAVPESAVMALGNETYVFLLDNGKARRQVIELGLRDGSGKVEVTKGLEAGETIISSGLQTLADGTPVNVIKGAVADADTKANRRPGT